MPEEILDELAELGQSVWIDDIGRAMLEDGTLKALIGRGLRGMTSNPSIFEKAIRESPAYDASIKELAGSGEGPRRIYDALTIADIRTAADLFLPVHERSGGLDGWVSLEVSPELARDTSGTIAEAARLHRAVGRPNVMIKIPATKEGFPAIEETLAAGISVNVTLIFSLAQYMKAAEAYKRGMGRLAGAGKPAGSVRSVASVFVSRVDTAVDGLLREKGAPKELLGTAAVANAARIYGKYLELFGGDGGAQRVLWGSTSTKDPVYSELKYVEELIGRGTVNTVPGKTLAAFLERGRCAEALAPESSRGAEEALKKLADAGADLDAVCARLLEDGLKTFSGAFAALLAALTAKAAALSREN